MTTSQCPKNDARNLATYRARYPLLANDGLLDPPFYQMAEYIVATMEPRQISPALRKLNYIVGHLPDAKNVLHGIRRTPRFEWEVESDKEYARIREGSGWSLSKKCDMDGRRAYWLDQQGFFPADGTRPWAMSFHDWCQLNRSQQDQWEWARQQYCRAIGKPANQLTGQEKQP